MKNLLMISGDRSLAQGKQGAFYNTLEEFSKHWERIDVIVPRVSNSSQINYFNNVHLHPSPWPLWLQPLWIFKKGRNLVREYKPGVMTVHDYAPFYNGLGAWLLSWSVKMPYMLEIMHIPGLPKAGSIKELLYRFLTRALIAEDVRGAKAVRIINQRQTKDFLLGAGVPARKLLYIPAFYIDPGVFNPQETEKRYDLVYAARLEKNKGIMSLVKAVQSLKKDRPDISLLIIGEGPLRKSIETYVHENSLQGNIEFSGWLQGPKDVANAYRSTRIFVNPSLNEGGPRVALEAMACGVPVISTRVGLMLDILKDEKNGIFSGWGPSQLASTISRMLEDEELRETCIRNGLETVRQFEKKESISRYAQALKDLGKKRLLVITQKVDDKDQLLGFFIEWLRRLGEKVPLSVLALQKGTFTPPISVSSLGKEHGRSKLAQLYRFLRYIFSHSGEYDVVFVHMNPIWAVLGGWYWRLAGKKVILWYTHKSVTFKLRVASFFSDVILTASPESFRLKSSKVIVTGHGIDTELFKPAPQHLGGTNILTVGRIAPVKNYEVLIAAAKILKDSGEEFHIDIAGEPALEQDNRYLNKLKKEIEEAGLEDYMTFLGKVDHGKLPELYQRHDIFVHMSRTGSLDKVILEAMASGLKVLSSNDSSRAFLGSELIFSMDDSQELAKKIISSKNSKLDPKLREYVVENHDLNSLIDKIVTIL